MTKTTFFRFWLLLTLGITTTVFTSCEKETTDEEEKGKDNETILSTDEWAIINGVKWSKFNVDAPGTFTANIEDAGMFYQWNRTKGWVATGDVTDWNNSTPTGDSWEIDNNVCPEGWRIPTKDEMQSLKDSDNKWTYINDVKGRVFGKGDNTIFLPAAAARIDYGQLFDEGGGNYWSSTQSDSDSHAHSLRFDPFRVNVNSNYRNYGLSIRCVAE